MDGCPVWAASVRRLVALPCPRRNILARNSARQQEAALPGEMESTATPFNANFPKQTFSGEFAELPNRKHQRAAQGHMFGTPRHRSRGFSPMVAASDIWSNSRCRGGP